MKSPHQIFLRERTPGQMFLTARDAARNRIDVEISARVVGPFSDRTAVLHWLRENGLPGASYDLVEHCAP